MPGGGAWGQNLEHLRIFISFTFFSCMELFIFESFVFERKTLFMADFLSVTLDYMVQCFRVGRGGGSKSMTSRFVFQQACIHVI